MGGSLDKFSGMQLVWENRTRNGEIWCKRVKNIAPYVFNCSKSADFPPSWRPEGEASDGRPHSWGSDGENQTPRQVKGRVDRKILKTDLASITPDV
jgi:hypothetical protein